jgi:hypothetical protein
MRVRRVRWAFLAGVSVVGARSRSYPAEEEAPGAQTYRHQEMLAGLHTCDQGPRAVPPHPGPWTSVSEEALVAQHPVGCQSDARRLLVVEGAPGALGRLRRLLVAAVAVSDSLTFPLSGPSF